MMMRSSFLYCQLTEPTVHGQTHYSDSLLILLNAAYLPILQSLVCSERDSNPRFTALEASTANHYTTNVIKFILKESYLPSQYSNTLNTYSKRYLYLYTLSKHIYTFIYIKKKKKRKRMQEECLQSVVDYLIVLSFFPLVMMLSLL